MMSVQDPVLLTCSHSLCLECARRQALHDGGTNTANITCVLCQTVTEVGGSDEARDAEDALIREALSRFDIVPPRKRGPRIEVGQLPRLGGWMPSPPVCRGLPRARRFQTHDPPPTKPLAQDLRACYECFKKNGHGGLGEEEAK